MQEKHPLLGAFWALSVCSYGIPPCIIVLMHCGAVLFSLSNYSYFLFYRGGCLWVTVVRLLCDGRNVRVWQGDVTGRHNKTVSAAHQCHHWQTDRGITTRLAPLTNAMWSFSSTRQRCSYLFGAKLRWQDWAEPVGTGRCCDRTWQGKSKVGGNVHNMTRHRVITAGMWQVIILCSSQQNVQFWSFSAWYLLAESDRGDRLELTG